MLSLWLRRLPVSTLFPYTTLFRSLGALRGEIARRRGVLVSQAAVEDPDFRRGPPAVYRSELVAGAMVDVDGRSEEHTSELQSLRHLVCRLLLEKKKKRRQSPLSCL